MNVSVLILLQNVQSVAKMLMFLVKGRRLMTLRNFRYFSAPSLIGSLFSPQNVIYRQTLAGEAGNCSTNF